jgi:sortase A
MNEEEIAAYEKELDITGTGIMGYITIPKIHVELPIYHGIDDAVLQIAIGHLTETSLPVGGEFTHCVVSGHRGLPSAKLFTDIDKLVEGDTWTVSVLNRTLTYEIDQIRIVEPTDLSALQIEPGKDYCTLVTCTPYGINTHRLLVRGHRVANANGDANVIADALQIEPIYVAPAVAIPMIIILLILLLIMTSKRFRDKVRRD